VLNADIHTWPSTGQAARSLGISAERVRQLIAAQRLSGVSTPFGWLVDPASVEQFRTERNARLAARGRAS
jgi:hypothetical protein